MKCEVSVLGVGETDYSADWKRVRSGDKSGNAYAYAATAFARALTDAGINKSDVDGIIVGSTLSYERTAEILGLDVRWGGKADIGQAICEAAACIQSGQAEVIALVYGNNHRSAGTSFGGPNASYGEEYFAYRYYAPWGLTSQGGIYALTARKLMADWGVTERDLGHVAVTQRRSAAFATNAIMQSELSIDDYLAARYIAEPLRLLDYTIVNDGGVALIIASNEFARRRGNGREVKIQSVGRYELNAGATSLAPRFTGYREGFERAQKQALDASALDNCDIDSLQVYDSFSCHVLFALVGLGFCKPEDLAGFLASGSLGLNGTLPVNTSGGHLSQSYMQGWNHQVEAVRQLRHEATGNQIESARFVEYVSAVAGKVVTTIYGG